MTMNLHKHEQGAVTGSLIAIIALSVVVLATGSLAIWAYMNYNEQKTNVDGKIALEVAHAQYLQSQTDAENFAKKEKEPNRQFVGPDDYGRLTFNYPKTWSVYVAKDVSKGGGSYEAYLNPVTVPPVLSSQQYSLRVLIEQRDYDQVIHNYDSLVKKGDLRSSVATSNGNSGTRLDGSFSNDIRGAAVIYKIRDKTVTIRTDADTFKPDFDAIVQTINFNS